MANGRAAFYTHFMHFIIIYRFFRLTINVAMSSCSENRLCNHIDANSCLSLLILILLFLINIRCKCNNVARRKVVHIGLLCSLSIVQCSWQTLRLKFFIHLNCLKLVIPQNRIFICTAAHCTVIGAPRRNNIL